MKTKIKKVFWIAICIDKKALFEGKGIAYPTEGEARGAPFKAKVIKVIEVKD